MQQVRYRIRFDERGGSGGGKASKRDTSWLKADANIEPSSTFFPDSLVRWACTYKNIELKRLDALQTAPYEHRQQLVGWWRASCLQGDASHYQQRGDVAQGDREGRRGVQCPGCGRRQGRRGAGQHGEALSR